MSTSEETGTQLDQPQMNNVASSECPQESSPPAKLELLFNCITCGISYQSIVSTYEKVELRCGRCEQLLVSSIPVKGCIYILSNKSMPGLVKIGFTGRDMDDRLKELAYASGVPEPFILEAVFHSSNPEKEEKHVHTKLASHRLQSNREFFKIDAVEAINAVQSILGRHPQNAQGVFGQLWQPKEPMGSRGCP